MDSKDLRNIASVYEAVYGGKKEEKKDTRLVVTAADKKANTKAYQNYKAGNKAYKAADHLKEDEKYGYDKDGNSLNPVDIEKRKKEDDDLAGAPNKKGKKKAKRWWDDDGDGIGYEKGEVKEGYAKPNTTVPRGSKVGPKKVAAPKGSKIHVATKEIEDLRKAAETGKGKYVAKADKLEEKKSSMTTYKYDDKFYKEIKKDDKEAKITPKKQLLNKEDVNDIMGVIYEKQKDTPDQVAAVIDMYRSKKGTGEAVKDTEKGDKKAAKKERDYAAWERSKMKKDDPDWKHKKGSTTESVDADYIEIVREIKSAETQADIKRWGALEESGNFSDQELAIIIEADIADILARLEKKRISKGGDPEESPLPAMRKYHADKKKKKVKEEVEIDEGIVRAIKKAKRIGKRILDAHDSDPGRAHTIGTLGNPNVRNDEKAAERRKNQKKYRGVKVKEGYQRDPEQLKKDKTHSKQPDPSKDGFTGIGNMSIKDIMKMNAKMKKEEFELDEAERKLADRLQRKRELYKKTTKKALEYARREGEAAGHARYRMGSLDREMDGIKARMNKEK